MVLSLKPAGAACNMHCAYCYYLEKSKTLHGATGRIMDAETLETAIRQYAEVMPADSDLQFLWHGGEPLLAPLEFYRKALELQGKYAAGRRVTNSIQTNGTLIDEATADFLAEDDWLTGISIDGNAAMHDANRHFADGSGTFVATMRAIALLDSRGAQWNAMATVNSANAADPEGFYDFFREIGAKYIQFSPVVERRRDNGFLASATENGLLTAESVTPRQWGDFLCRLFDRWVRADVGRVFVQIFEATLAGTLGAFPGVCIFAPVCGGSPVVEANGDVYCCDHFAFDRYRLGNIHTTPLGEILAGDALGRFGDAKATDLPAECRRCRYVALCNGECPRNRFGEGGTNYLCEGYKQYFAHTRRFMEDARRQILASQRRF